MMNLQNSMKKSKLVSVCSTQFAGLSIDEPILFKAFSKSEHTQIHKWIPSFPENLLYYEHYKTSRCKWSNHLSFILLGGDDNGRVEHDFTTTEYSRVLSVDFSNHLRSVAASFHVVSQLPNCENVRFVLADTNIELSTTDTGLYKKGTSKSVTTTTTTPSTRVKYLEIRAGDADATIKEEKWESNPLTRVDEILKYAKANWSNLKVIKIKLVSPTLATRANYARVIEEFLDEEHRGTGSLPKLVQHCTSIHGGAVRCEPFKPTGHSNNGQISKGSGEPKSGLHATTTIPKSLQFTKNGNGTIPARKNKPIKRKNDTSRNLLTNQGVKLGVAGDVATGADEDLSLLIPSSSSWPSSCTSYIGSSGPSPSYPLKGSTYEEWENSSSDEQQRPSNTSSKPSFTDVMKALNDIPVSVEQLKKILNTVNANEKKMARRRRVE